jgi:hypothetical protein
MILSTLTDLNNNTIRQKKVKGFTLFIAFIAFFPVLLQAQEAPKDLIYNGKPGIINSPFLMTGIGGTKIDTLQAVTFSLKFGSIQNFKTGWAFDVSLQITEDSQDKLRSNLYYNYITAQAGMGYYIVPFHKYNITVLAGATGGIGALMQSYTNYDDTNDSGDSFTKVYLYLEPSVHLLYSLSNGFSLGATTNYRVATHCSNTGLARNALNSLNIQAEILLGF